jgi:hypothetical protein
MIGQILGAENRQDAKLAKPRVCGSNHVRSFATCAVAVRVGESRTTTTLVPLALLASWRFILLSRQPPWRCRLFPRGVPPVATFCRHRSFCDSSCGLAAKMAAPQSIGAPANAWRFSGTSTQTKNSATRSKPCPGAPWAAVSCRSDAAVWRTAAHLCRAAPRCRR